MKFTAQKIMAASGVVTAVYFGSVWALDRIGWPKYAREADLVKIQEIASGNKRQLDQKRFNELTQQLIAYEKRKPRHGSSEASYQQQLVREWHSLCKRLLNNNYCNKKWR